MINPNDYLAAGLQFHVHTCPAMPMGRRDGASDGVKLLAGSKSTISTLRANSTARQKGTG